MTTGGAAAVAGGPEKGPFLGKPPLPRPENIAEDPPRMPLAIGVDSGGGGSSDGEATVDGAAAPRMEPPAMPGWPPTTGVGKSD